VGREVWGGTEKVDGAASGVGREVWGGTEKVDGAASGVGREVWGGTEKVDGIASGRLQHGSHFFSIDKCEEGGVSKPCLQFETPLHYFQMEDEEAKGEVEAWHMLGLTSVMLIQVGGSWGGLGEGLLSERCEGLLVEEKETIARRTHPAYPPHGKRDSSHTHPSWQEGLIPHTPLMARGTHPAYPPHGKRDSSRIPPFAFLPHLGPSYV
jgi:hypothetical protein